jgi:hypothetical protein
VWEFKGETERDSKYTESDREERRCIGSFVDIISTRVVNVVMAGLVFWVLEEILYQ